MVAATSKMEHFVIIINDWKLLSIITKRSILDAAAALDPSLVTKSDMGRGCYKKAQATHSNFLCVYFSCNSIISSLVFDGVLIILQ